MAVHGSPLYSSLGAPRLLAIQTPAAQLHQLVTFLYKVLSAAQQQQPASQMLHFFHYATCISSNIADPKGRFGPCYLNLNPKPGIGCLTSRVLFLYLLLKNLPLSLFCFRRLLMVWFWFLTIYCFLNSASDLPSVRHEAVQAWLETVPGGSLVMFYVFQCTITLPVSSPCLQQLSWYFNPGLTALSLLHDEVEGGREAEGVCMHALLRQSVLAWTRRVL